VIRYTTSQIGTSILARASIPMVTELQANCTRDTTTRMTKDTVAIVNGTGTIVVVLVVMFVVVLVVLVVFVLLGITHFLFDTT
jgi:hypothetical protein